jgi:alpha-tubulin suppressor-like RCC1 family protein
VRSNGAVACWGDNDKHQATAPEGNFVSVSAGSFHTCGLKTDGNIKCWGSNTSGQATPPAGPF